MEKKQVQDADANDDKSMEEGSEDEGDFFKEKGGVGQKVDSDGEGEEVDRGLPSLSKKAMRKIKPEGPYAGKNIVKFDAQGNAVNKTEFDSDYLTALRQSAAYHDQAGAFTVQRDTDLANTDQSKLQDKHLARVKQTLEKNMAVDSKMAKDRIKDKRIKLKKRLRAEMGYGEDREEGDGGYDVVLGTSSEERSGDEDDHGDSESRGRGSSSGHGGD